MIVSLNEIENAALKAARGAGFSWGLSEEAGGAARWLARHALGWLPALLDLLDGASTLGEPELDGGTIRARAAGMPLCPLRTGAYLADVGRDGLPAGLLHVRSPLYLVPFASRISRRSAAALAVDIGPIPLWLDPEGRAAAAGLPLSVPAIADASLAVGTGAPPGAARLIDGGSTACKVDAALWRRLGTWEARTYVAASERSRIEGAGAGLADSD